MPKQKARMFLLGCAVLGCLGTLDLARASTASDRELRARLAAQIHQEQRLEGTQVHVAVQQREVVLAGTVALYSQKMLYKHIVWRTPGVSKLDNAIRVVPRLPVEDAEIVGHIQTVLNGHPRFHQVAIAVHVTEGAVRLHGMFHDPDDVLSLQQQVAEINGVVHLEILARFAA